MTSKYFQQPKSGPPSPRIRTWRAYRTQAGGPVRVSVWREREAIGYGPPMFHIEFLDSEGNVQHHDESPWKIDLDDWLVQEGHRAVSPNDEVLRYSFRIRGCFKPLWENWGDGYFNSLLMKTVREGPYANDPRMRAVLDSIRENPPAASHQLAMQLQEVESVFYVLAGELVKQLRYSNDTAEAILLGAIITYLDDRFHVGDRRRLFGSRGAPLTAKKIAALALADVLTHVLRVETGNSPSAYFFGAIQNIERGDDVSVDVNWPIIGREIGSALPQGYISTEIKDTIRAGIEKKLAAHDPEVVDEACSLLATTVGGDALTYRRTWGKSPR